MTKRTHGWYEIRTTGQSITTKRTHGWYEAQTTGQSILMKRNRGWYHTKDFFSKLKFKMNFRDNRHLLACKMPSPVALGDNPGRMILSGEVVIKIRCS
jgi:hypothetical protein